MANFTVGITASISVIVEADSESEALQAGQDYVSISLSPEEDEVEAWNTVQSEEGATTTINEATGWTIESSEVDAPEE